MHSCMHMKIHNWLKQEELSLFFSFVQSKLSEYQLCVPNWEYSSEHDGAYHPAASRPITSIILTSEFLYVLWNRPGAKRRFNRKSWPTWRNQTRSLWGRNTWDWQGGKWKSSVSREKSLSALTQKDIYWTENQPVWLQRGNEDGIMTGRGWFLQGV